jgi:hypothetical protein
MNSRQGKKEYMIWKRCETGKIHANMLFILSATLADIQRRGSILTWIVILSVYVADTIAIDLSLSELISLFMISIIGFLNNSNLHAIIYTL